MLGRRVADRGPSGDCRSGRSLGLDDADPSRAHLSSSAEL